MIYHSQKLVPNKTKKSFGLTRSLPLRRLRPLPAAPSPGLLLQRPSKVLLAMVIAGSSGDGEEDANGEEDQEGKRGEG